MPTRERWIVYPLLFLTLGIAMRDKIIHPNHLQTENIAAAQIRCGQLTADNVLCGRMQAAEAIDAPLLAAMGTNGKRAVVIVADPRTNVGVVKTDALQCREVAVVGGNGRPTVVAGTDSKTKAGVIVTFSANGVPESQIPPGKPGRLNDKATPEKPQTPPGSSAEPAPSSSTKTSP
jgi:hypothetical protein